MNNTVRVSSARDEHFVFRKAVWETEDSEQGLTVRGIPGTWCKSPQGSPSWCIGLLCCPNCGTNALLHESIHVVGKLGRLDREISCRGCSFARTCFLDEWHKPLYACCIEVDGEAQIHYMHANNVAEARIELGAIRYKKSYLIVGIARAIGFIATDNHGELLRA
jgi:hypothetical protein